MQAHYASLCDEEEWWRRSPPVLSVSCAVFPKPPKHNRMGQRHSRGPQGVLLQQLDDPAIPAASAALHTAQLHPLPEVSRSVWSSFERLPGMLMFHWWVGGGGGGGW